MKLVFLKEQLSEVAQKILAQNPHKIIIFNGEMGAGKTTLIKELCIQLGVNDATSSPTFSLVNEYKSIDNHSIYHFDFYRIKQESEAMDMGVDDYFYSGNYCFVEWPEKIPNLIPENHSEIKLTILEDGQRELIIN